MTKYRTVEELYYPTDPDILHRLAAGEDIPLPERHMRTVRAGKEVDDIPEQCIAGLLAKGWIELVAEPEVRSVRSPRVAWREEET